MENFIRQPVGFMSHGLRCAGILYLPDRFPTDTGKLPCLILANGFTGTMDWLIPDYAARFVRDGIAVLIFDYRYFGQSEGKPRQLVCVKKQRQDIQAAIAFTRNHNKIDPKRIALWGTSLGGGHVFYVAAEDSRIAAVIAQVPAFDMVSKKARALIQLPAKVVIRLMVAALWDGLRGMIGLAPYYAKVYGKPGETAVFNDPELKTRFDHLMNRSTYWRNQFTPRFYLKRPRYKAGTAEKFKIPLLVCIASREVYANPAFQAWVGKQAPLGEVKEYQADHFDFYHGMSSQVIEDQVDFLRRNLL